MYTLTFFSLSKSRGYYPLITAIRVVNIKSINKKFKLTFEKHRPRYITFVSSSSFAKPDFTCPKRRQPFFLLPFFFSSQKSRVSKLHSNYLKIIILIFFLFEMTTMESLIGLVNRIQQACTKLGDYGGSDNNTFSSLWEALPSVAVVGGQVTNVIRVF